MNLETILGSIVIGGIISGLVSIMINRRQSNLQYITAERKEWRKEIREISYKLCGASYKDTLLLLASLKTRINAFGNNSNKYIEDAHIWELIKKIEMTKPSKEVLKIQQEQLIEYLSLLLKFDWERSKVEVKGNLFNYLSCLTLIAVTIYFAISLFMCNQHTDISVFNLSTLILIYIVLLIINSLLFIIVVRTTCSRIINGTINEQPEQSNYKKLCKCYMYWGIAILAMLYVYGHCMYIIYSSIGDGKDDFSILLSVLIFLLGMIFQYIYQAYIIDRDYNYNNSINIVRATYKRKYEEYLLAQDKDREGMVNENGN